MINDQSLSTLDTPFSEVSNEPIRSQGLSPKIEESSLVLKPSMDFHPTALEISPKALKYSDLYLTFAQSRFREITSSVTSLFIEMLKSEFTPFPGLLAVERAVSSYQSGIISLGRASEIAGLPYDQMIELLQRRGIRLRFGPASPEEAEEEQQIFWKRVRGQQDLPRG